MDSKVFCLFWILLAVPQKSQGSVTVSVTPNISAFCDQPVSLHCNASSVQKGLSVGHMSWIYGGQLCSVNNTGIPVTHRRNSPSDFRCAYEDGRLSLVFQRAPPLEEAKSTFMCKLHSNQGVAYGSTTVKLQECGEAAEGVLTTDGPTCTFRRVFPDGDVDWFHGNRNLSDGSVKPHTKKTVDSEGWLTVTSWLSLNKDSEHRVSKEPYNCSLRSAASGRYVASSLVHQRQPRIFGGAVTWKYSNGAQIVVTCLGLIISLFIM